MPNRRTICTLVAVLTLGILWLNTNALFSFADARAASDLPEIVRDQPRTLEFSTRIRERIRVGIGEAELVEQLTQLGFHPSRQRRTMLIGRFGFPCAHMWLVVWESDQSNTVTTLEGKYQLGACL